MSFTDELLDHFRGKLKEVKLVTSGGGVFEVTVNDQLVYSKKETGTFPDPKEVIETIEKMMK
ncbi:selenoprotein [Halalkalibacter okhensis]|uniref:Selenoprotein n=1 Tax=Halalkalibacter okhensis TaxID=333138 RepID=A0A0B0ILE9_9BACI|nr:selenoprotein [Halalkalibacter okhensis]